MTSHDEFSLKSTSPLNSPQSIWSRQILKVQFEASSKKNLECVSTKFTENRPFIDHLKAICLVMRPQKEFSYTNSESPQKMLFDDMLRFVFVYGARFADALYRIPRKVLPIPKFLISPSFFICVNDYLGSTLESLFYMGNNGSHSKNPEIKTPLVAKNE